jgi:hypothetical protein
MKKITLLTAAIGFAVVLAFLRRRTEPGADFRASEIRRRA